ncbi:MAG: hypothetical protein RJA36_3971 [Pseudomonadota bacterium]|jgi:hypothetical protein
MATATLSIDLEARLARLEQDMSRATKLVERSAGQMERSFAAAGRQITSALGAISATVVVGAMTQIASATIKGIDALNDFADATGTTVENASALEDIARRTGSSVESVSGALIKFNAQIQEGLKPGSEAARVFELIGLNAKELAAIDPAEALLKTAQALAQFEDNGNKARIIYALFGKSTREVAPLLKDLAESGKLNATVTAQQAAEAEKFEKAMARLSKNITDVARAIASDLLGPINQLIERVTLAREKLGGFGGIVAAAFGSGAARQDFDSPQKALDYYSAKLSEIDGKIKAIQANPDGGPLGELADRNKLNALRANREEVGKLADLYRGMVNAGGAGGGRGTGGNTGRPSLPLLPPAAGGAGKAGKVEIPFAITDARESYKSAFLKAEKDYEETDKLLTQIQAKADEAARKLRESISEEGRRVFEATRTPAEQLAAEIDKLNKLLQAGAIDWDTYTRAQLDAQERFDKSAAGIKDQASKTKSLGEELGLSFTSAFEDAIVGGNSLRDVLKGLEADIIRIVTRKLITEPLGNALTGMLGGGGSGGGGNFLASIGNWFGSLFAGGFAEGGFIPPGKWGMTGERGPEPIFGGRAGVTVRPAGGMSVTNHFTISGPVDRRTQQQIAAAALRGVQMASQRGN